MIRLWVCGLCVVLFGGHIQAHFLYLLPVGEGNPQVRVVFGDRMTPDTDRPVEAVRDGKFWVVSPAGQVTPAKPVHGEKGTGLEPADAAVGALGTVEYGVVLRGQDEPVLIVHHASTIPLAVKLRKSSPAPALEITSVVRGGGVAFAVTALGKPVGSADVVVEVPGEKRPRAVKTDAEGATPAFEVPGTYSARTSWVEDRAGEFRGRSYKQVRHYATLVVRHDGARQP